MNVILCDNLSCKIIPQNCTEALPEGITLNSSSLSPAPRAGASNTPVFFDAERQRFFRPLNSSRRELVAACLRALYDRLHGPASSSASPLYQGR
ncbi:ATP-dependent helicase HrpA [Burkholderia pseudomallei]|nr:ATP-dependent helicase HrpA [Burkholderia pseudomallei]